MMVRPKVAMKSLFAVLALFGAAAPTLAAVDVSADSIVRPPSDMTWYWRFCPTALARCRSTDSAALSAWLSLVNPRGVTVYRDSLAPTILAPGEDTVLTFAQYEMEGDAGRWTARCSVAAPGDTCPANDTLTKSFYVWPTG
jgi:hypothetical protein